MFKKRIDILPSVKDFLPINNVHLDRMSAHNFTYEYWKGGSLATFGIRTRKYAIQDNRNIIRRYAIGYIDGSKLWLRPKQNTVAIMYFFKDEHFWSHLNKDEFEICFPELVE